MAQKTYGTFTRDGVTMVAYSPADAVRMRFDGWTEHTAPQPAADAEPAADDKPAAAKATKAAAREDSKSTSK